MTGKEKCRRLKAIRKVLADHLGVDIHQVECTFEGECRGTCPKCKQEERDLNAAILRRGATMAGAAAIAMSLAACVPNKPEVELSGEVAYTGEDAAETNDASSAEGDGTSSTCDEPDEGENDTKTVEIDDDELSGYVAAD